MRFYAEHLVQYTPYHYGTGPCEHNEITGPRWGMDCWLGCWGLERGRVEEVRVWDRESHAHMQVSSLSCLMSIALNVSMHDKQNTGVHVQTPPPLRVDIYFTPFSLTAYHMCRRENICHRTGREHTQEGQICNRTGSHYTFPALVKLINQGNLTVNHVTIMPVISVSTRSTQCAVPK